MELQYKLKMDEAEEALLCLEWKKEGRRKYVNAVILSLVAVGCLISYLMDTERFYLLAFAGAAVAVLFAMLYLPDLRRRRRARAMVPPGGVYRIKLPQQNFKRGFESEHVFTIQSAEAVYCIPKRVLDRRQAEEIRSFIREHAEKIFEIVTGRE